MDFYMLCAQHWHVTRSEAKLKVLRLMKKAGASFDLVEWSEE